MTEVKTAHLSGDAQPQMNFGFSDEQLAMRDAAKGFVERYCSREQVRQWDDEGIFPRDLYVRMAQMGWLGLMVPEEYGGTGGSLLDLVAIYEVIARHSVDVPTRLALTFWGQINLLMYGTQPQRDRYLAPSVRGEIPLSFSLSEPNSGSDAASVSTFALRDRDDWVINGQKLFCTGAGMENNVMIVAVRTNRDAPKHQGISMLLVPCDTPGVEVRKMRTIGRRIVGTNEAYFTDARVPAGNLLGPLDGGWGCITSHLERERLTLAAMYLGNAQGALDDAVLYARQREQFGRPIGKNQAVRHMLAEAAMDVEAGRWLTYRGAWLHAKGLPCSREATMAKVFVSEMWQRTTAVGMQVLGGHAYTMDHPMQRYWRDARNGTVGGGTSQILRDVIATTLDL
jgi:alkylation response protein AidB-like acyl-CoA dehydrogenase